MRNAVSLKPKPGGGSSAEQPDHQVDAIDIVAAVGLPIDAAQFLRAGRDACGLASSSKLRIGFLCMNSRKRL